MSIDLKKEAAREALKLIPPGSRIGFGAGSTMAHLVHLLKEEETLAASVMVLTSSFNTKNLLEQAGFVLKETGTCATIDLYFDGCDQFDRRLNALKSGGGIHTKEKILAAMANSLILVGDESKFVEKLDGRYPVVVEVIPEALAFVMEKIQRLFHPSSSLLRMSDKKEGAVITENGNYLIDLFFTTFPEPELLDHELNGIPGLLEHSLFYNMADRAVIAGGNGVRIIGK